VIKCALKKLTRSQLSLAHNRMQCPNKLRFYNRLRNVSFCAIFVSISSLHTISHSKLSPPVIRMATHINNVNFDRFRFSVRGLRGRDRQTDRQTDWLAATSSNRPLLGGSVTSKLSGDGV